ALLWVLASQQLWLGLWDPAYGVLIWTGNARGAAALHLATALLPGARAPVDHAGANGKGARRGLSAAPRDRATERRVDTWPALPGHAPRLHSGLLAPAGERHRR